MGVLLRHWVPDDAEGLGRAIAESAEHLRPWIPWMAGEPRTPDQRRATIGEWEENREDGGDAVYGIFVGGRVAGGCGLHRRVGPHALAIGYWVHVAFVRRGVATTAARLLVDAAFCVPGIDAVEIHHDKANSASSGVPRALGFRLVDEHPDPAQAPGDSGIECIWRLERQAWLTAAGSPR